MYSAFSRFRHPPVMASPYISKQEEDFLALCRKNGVECKLQESPDGNRVYAVTFTPEYLDSTEKAVVEYCKEHNIKYTFFRDTDGIHHYEFSKMIDMWEESSSETHVNLINFNKILNRHPVVREPEPIKPVKKWEKLLSKCLAKLGLCRVKKPKPKTEEEEFLESMGMTPESREDMLKLAFDNDYSAEWNKTNKKSKK